jgi:hypothetical protein
MHTFQRALVISTAALSLGWAVKSASTASMTCRGRRTPPARLAAGARLVPGALGACRGPAAAAAKQHSLKSAQLPPRFPDDPRSLMQQQRAPGSGSARRGRAGRTWRVLGSVPQSALHPKRPHAGNSQGTSHLPSPHTGSVHMGASRRLPRYASTCQQQQHGGAHVQRRGGVAAAAPLAAA